MEDRPYLSFRRRVKEAGPLWGIIIVSASIRFYYSHHPLISDEVFNLVTIERLAKGEGCSEYFFRHPPLYLFISFLASSLIGNYPQIPSFISIIFSVLSLIPLYRVTEQLFDKKTALWASVFLSIMPANTTYSAWIKQDAMLLFFFLLALDFYLKGQFLLSGVAAGIALLVKEFALFFSPLSLLITIFINERKNWLGWIKMTAVALIISSWWYILFGETFYQVTVDALIGGNIKELGWHFPWWFYINNAPYDLSYPILILFLIGVIFLIKEIYQHGAFSKYIFPIMWIGIFYFPLSFITVKAPWYIYLATPAMAIVAGFGVVRLVNLVQRTAIRLISYFGLIVSLMLAMYSFDNVSFIKKVSGITGLEDFRKIQGENWNDLLEKKKIWRQVIRGKGKVAFLEFKPILSYLIDIGNDNIVILKVSQFLAFDRSGFLNFARDNGIVAFVINTESLTYTEEKLIDMTSLWGAPKNIDSLLVFQTGY